MEHFVIGDQTIIIKRWNMQAETNEQQVSFTMIVTVEERHMATVLVAGDATSPFLQR